MKIFRENGEIRFQLMDLEKGIMLFDFTIEDDKKVYEELREHIISNLEFFFNHSKSKGIFKP